ncbi:MAG: CoA transferase, partial [Alphaproteobacteria bacterium]
PDDEAPGGVLPMHNIIPRLSGTPGAIRRATPSLGQDTDAILAGLGLSAEEIAALKADGIAA